MSIKINEPRLPGSLITIADIIGELERSREDETDFCAGRFEKLYCESTDFSSLCFKDCLFMTSRFTDCDFTKCAFINCIFKGCDLSNSDFSDSCFKQCSFSSCKAVGAAFKGSYQKNVIFDGGSFEL